MKLLKYYSVLLLGLGNLYMVLLFLSLPTVMSFIALLLWVPPFIYILKSNGK